jgi:5-methylcytosine-specific restriction endonuclease McrA
VSRQNEATPVSCFQCGRLTQNTKYCGRCRRLVERARNARPAREAYRDPAYREIPRVGACVDCGSTQDLTRDHRPVPVSKGGSVQDGIVIACRSCNSSRGARMSRGKADESRRSSEAVIGPNDDLSSASRCARPGLSDGALHGRCPKKVSA